MPPSGTYLAEATGATAAGAVRAACPGTETDHRRGAERGDAGARLWLRPARRADRGLRRGLRLCAISGSSGLHSITSSARARRESGMERPSALAVLRLM